MGCEVRPECPEFSSANARVRLTRSTKLDLTPTYCIDDVADAVRRALFADKPLSRAYNIGLDKAYNSEHLVHAIRNALPQLKFEIGQHPNAAEVAPPTVCAARWIFLSPNRNWAGRRRSISKKASRASRTGCWRTNLGCACNRFGTMGTVMGQSQNLKAAA